MKKLLAAVCFLLVGHPMAQAQDWSGTYGVLGISTINGGTEDLLFGIPSSSSDASGRLVSLAVGYNLQNGNLVYGGELAYSSGDTEFPDYSDANYLDGMIDLKARIGYAAGKMLWYGTLGYARSDRSFSGPVTNDPLKVDGISYGVGVDMMVSDRVLIGLEVLRRNLTAEQGEIGGYPDWSTEHSLTSIGLRVGFRF